jgi:hypothetical protein
LHKAGYLYSRRWFVVIEWQGNGFPHWHLLLDATWIPFGAITDTWDKFRPPWLPPPEGVRPPMGCCRFTASKFDAGGALHAARYVAKYVSKFPADGFPEWVTARKNIRRFSTSRGFWSAPVDWSSEEEEISAIAARDTDGQDEAEEAGAVQEEAHRGEGRSIRERVAACCTTCNVFAVYECVDPFTGKVTEEEVWVAAAACDVRESAEILGPAYTLENYYTLFVPVDCPEPWHWSRFLIASGACGKMERARFDRDFARAIRPEWMVPRG